MRVSFLLRSSGRGRPGALATDRRSASGQRGPSDDPDVLRLFALAARCHVELDLLALFEGLVAGPGDVRVVDEHVLAVVPGDEPVALVVDEELDGTGSHCAVSSRAGMTGSSPPVRSSLPPVGRTDAA